MSIDCEKLSPKAQEIFKQLKPFFPPDPWNNPRWFEEGRVLDNGEFDLRKSADRTRLEERKKSMIGFCVAGIASSYRKEHDSLQGFANLCIGSSVESCATFLLILQDLDFQIETLDLCGE
jgi:hypothetical protein